MTLQQDLNPREENHKPVLKRLQNKFPKLWVEYPREFHTFFNVYEIMNNNGRRAYSIIKTARRKRMRQ
ncbi:MAG: hypothetical protein U9Q12_00835 [Patescibacteria group bacterium]|nr:hypothetical protein [Patescibacteria group bacterium]